MESLLTRNPRACAVLFFELLCITQRTTAFPVQRNLWDDLDLGGLIHPSRASDASNVAPSVSPLVVTITEVFTETINALATPSTASAVTASATEPLVTQIPNSTAVSPPIDAIIPNLSNATGGQVTPSSIPARLNQHHLHHQAVSDTVVAAYYADWASNKLSPEQVDFGRFNWIDFAFAIPNEKFELEFTQESSSQLLHRLVAAAHGQGRNVKLSIGGWTGSAHFSRAVRTSAGRTTLCKSILEAYQTYNLDGIDLDWEYPNSPGAGNEYGSDDSEHFVKFLRQLRKTLPPTARITAAASDLPFMGKDGQPMTDVSAFADVLDWVLLMNYDVFGSSPTPGPNAPLSNSCGSSAQPLANAEAAIRSWTSAGFSPKQLVLGIPAYGYISRSTAKQLASRDEGAGNSTSGGGTSGDGGNASDNGEDLAINAVDSVELTSDDGSSDGGQVSFQALVRQGALVRNNGGGYDGGGGFERNWDDCSSTPWLRSEARSQVITYDDPTSMELKGELGRRMGLLGVNMFAADGDDGWALIDGARRGLGVL